MWCIYHDYAVTQGYRSDMQYFSISPLVNLVLLAKMDLVNIKKNYAHFFRVRHQELNIYHDTLREGISS